MWSDSLLKILSHSGYSSDWPSKMEAQLKGLFGSSSGRYRSVADKLFRIRAPRMPAAGANDVPFAALIHESNPDVGAYGGTSLAFFPSENAPSLIAFVVGTSGLAPDENILGRPGHARKVRALCAWLNGRAGSHALLAWAKQDPTRIDIPVPQNIVDEFPEYGPVFRKYGNVLYGIYAPCETDRNSVDALTAFLDIMLDERGERPLAQFRQESDEIRRSWMCSLLPKIDQEQVAHLLRLRRYLVLEGPPGTGKTRMARRVLKEQYAGNGCTVQFHANTTYENFVGGLAPESTSDSLGLRFAPKRGSLLEAALAARQTQQPYLLCIDEINRADLSKVLGEAIYLLEVESEDPRTIELPYDFGSPMNTQLTLPPNLHILGTMNTADRSLGFIDIAVRRRFAFTKFWPQLDIVERESCPLMVEAFTRLLNIFVEDASEDSFNLMPGHSYFLEKDDSTARQRLRVTLAPLLEDYLSQGYVTSFAEPLRSYLQWLGSL